MVEKLAVDGSVGAANKRYRRVCIHVYLSEEQPDLYNP